VLPEGCIDDELALWWLVDKYDSNSKQHCPGEAWLPIPEGHGSHITCECIDNREQNNIVVYCLPVHSTYLPQPLDVEHCSPHQHIHLKAVENYFLTTNIGISRNSFFSWFNKAWQEASSKESIVHAFTACGIVPHRSKGITENLQPPGTQGSSTNRNHITLEQTTHTKCQFRQPVSLCLTFANTTTEGEITGLILHFAHLAVCALMQVDIIAHGMTRLRNKFNIAKPL